eukprot:scaffold50187_cov61-Phaeocystis_antarctica.AAC.1
MQQLRQLLLGAAASDSPHARLSAVVWAGRFFPSDDVPSRYICLLGAADARPEVREEALRRSAPPRRRGAAAALHAGQPRLRG